MSCYDVLILGAGTASVAAAVTCARSGLKALILEKHTADYCKPCGDGICENGIDALSSIGIFVDQLIDAGANPIRRSIHFWHDHKAEIPHDNKRFLVFSKPLLLRRLRQQAKASGVRILYHAWEQPVYRNGQWEYGDIAKAPYLINASGCQTGAWQDRDLRRHLPIGGMMIVSAKSSLDEDRVWFWHLTDDEAGYEWAFPLGEGRWNVGVWRSRNTAGIKASMRGFFREWKTKYSNNTTVLREDRYAFLGTQSSLRANPPDVPWCAAGDITGTCRTDGGEGISGAVQSGIRAGKQCIERYNHR